MPFAFWRRRSAPASSKSSTSSSGAFGFPRLPARPAGAVAAALALYVTVAGNLPLWQALIQVGRAPSAYLPLMLGMGWWLFFGLLALLALLAWPRVLKPAGLLLAVLAGVVQHYMLNYHMVMDPAMAANVLQTDLHEAADLLSPRLLAHVLCLALPVAAWFACQPIRAQRPLRRAGANLLLCAAALGLLAAGTLALSRQLAPLMRNEPQLRYMMNPLASLYAGGAAWWRSGAPRSPQRVAISADAHLKRAAGAKARPPLLVLVVGETARADHFGLNGYARDTTPELARRGVLSWPQVSSCGTSTLASLPCMFSHLGRAGFEARASEYENLLDVLQAAGLAVLWLDNQSGCKGVCERVPHAAANDPAQAARHTPWCSDGECLDEALLDGLDARLAALPAERAARGVVLVLHPMGSHGPAYARRSAPAYKRFLPECTQRTLSDCSHAELVNAYDNSIAYTDHVLARTIDWLQQQAPRFDSGLLYLSDHGESLGEYGLYLHGMPYALAPEVQKHIPMVTWLAGGLDAHTGIDADCARRGRDAARSHDNLYHTVLGLMGVGSSTYRPALDLFDGCRSGEVEG